MQIPENIMEIFKREPNIGRDKLAEEANISNQLARMYCRDYKGQTHHKQNEIIKRGVAIGDIHYPYQNKETINIIHEFCKNFKPDYFLLTGDQMDMDCISVYNKNKPKLLEGKRLKHEYVGFQKDILDRFEVILKPDCKKYFFWGNHEYRCTRLMESDPQYEGWIEPENNLNLEGYHIIPFNDPLNIGEMWFIHGDFWNKYHSEKNARIYGSHIFSWHCHTNQIYTMHSPINRLPRQGVSVGCTCNKNPYWLRNKPNAWVHGFLFFYLFEDGSFSYYLPIVIGNRCIINNKLYGE